MGSPSVAPAPLESSEAPDNQPANENARPALRSVPDDAAPPLPDLGWAQCETNPFLQGNFTPVHDEISVDGLEVIGELPRALNGSFLRNGPNPMFEPMAQYHVFDGDGMLHGVRIEDGKASYRNRWVQTAGLYYEQRQGRSCFSGLAEFQPPSMEAMKEVGMAKNPVNTHVISHAGQIYALAEGGPPHAIRDDLSTIGPHDYGGRLGPNMTAHPHEDPETGELFAFGYSFATPSAEYYVIDADGELFHRQTVPLRAPIMMHDFMITENYAIFYDAPAVFNAVRGLVDGDFVSWQPEMGTRIGVMPRYGHAASIKWFEVENGYIFHFFNAYEEGGKVIIDAPVMPYLNARGGVGNGSNLVHAIPHRFELDMKSGHSTRTKTFETGTEFSVIDPRRCGRKHRHGYGYVAGADSLEMMTNFRYGSRFDFETGVETRHDFGESCTTGEMVYAADPNSDNEDDGWMISMVYDNDRRTSELVVVQAGDMAGEPVARVRMPRRLPFGFHGSWVAAE